MTWWREHTQISSSSITLGTNRWMNANANIESRMSWSNRESSPVRYSTTPPGTTDSKITQSSLLTQNWTSISNKHLPFPSVPKSRKAPNFSKDWTKSEGKGYFCHDVGITRAGKTGKVQRNKPCHQAEKPDQELGQQFTEKSKVDPV